ncbi:MAG: hypothetical protein HUU21_39195 [Polyangiaceae bacterium]|nr:hypothetical protein [Polyangiaceae bacterium]NUQ79572.1 hypothetical protein [Polyangiaceae bacterium]
MKGGLGREAELICEAFCEEILALAREAGVKDPHIALAKVSEMLGRHPIIHIWAQGAEPEEIPDVPGVPAEPRPGGWREVGRRLASRRIFRFIHLGRGGWFEVEFTP